VENIRDTEKSRSAANRNNLSGAKKRAPLTAMFEKREMDGGEGNIATPIHPRRRVKKQVRSGESGGTPKSRPISSEVVESGTGKGDAACEKKHLENQETHTQQLSRKKVRIIWRRPINMLQKGGGKEERKKRDCELH